MPGVRRVPVAVMDVVDVIAVRHRDMPAIRAMLMVVAVMGDVPRGLALVEMAVVLAMHMAVVHIVDMVAVRNGYMSATWAVNMIMTAMSGMNLRHGTPFP